MTTKESREYETPVGRFVFTNMKRDAFFLGIRNIETNGYSFLIASPEKALCDLIGNTPSLYLRYRKEAAEYLEEDIRLDMEAFQNFNPMILSNISPHTAKRRHRYVPF